MLLPKLLLKSFWCCLMTYNNAQWLLTMVHQPIICTDLIDTLKNSRNYSLTVIKCDFSLSVVNICDEELLMCQNGGTCHQNQRCICPHEFKGVLCQHSRCEDGKKCNHGDHNGASVPALSLALLVLCPLLTLLLGSAVLLPETVPVFLPPSHTSTHTCDGALAITLLCTLKEPRTSWT